MRVNDLALSTESRPHVAFVLQGLGAGGSEHIVSLLCNHFAQLGWLVTLLAFEERDSEPYYQHHPSVRILRLGSRARKMSLAGGVRTVRSRVKLLSKAFEVLAPDLVISFLTRTNIMSVLAAEPLGIPVIVSERNNPELQRVGPVWEALRSWTYRRAYGLITMTKGAMEYFPPPLRKREWIIPNPATFDEHPGRQQSQGGRNIVAVGRLVPQKGFDLLMEAFSRTKARSDWKLIIWGDGPDRASLESQRERLGLGESVTLPGVTQRPGAWLQDADIFVLSSRFEGWGLVLSEAMAAGLPVISFDCRWGPAEMIAHGESGLLVPAGDVDAMAVAIDRLCGNEEVRRSLGTSARRTMERFRPAEVLQLWERVVREALRDLRDARQGSAAPESGLPQKDSGRNRNSPIASGA